MQLKIKAAFLSLPIVLPLIGAGVYDMRKNAPPRTWDMVPLEAAGARHVSSEVGTLRSEIARVASGDQARLDTMYSVASAVQQLDRDDEELRREAERRCGVAVVQSGSLWVERK